MPPAPAAIATAANSTGDGDVVSRVPNQGDFVQINAENRHGDTRVTLSNTIGSSGTFCNGIWPLSVLPTALPVGVDAMKSTMRMPVITSPKTVYPV